MSSLSRFGPWGSPTVFSKAHIAAREPPATSGKQFAPNPLVGARPPFSERRTVKLSAPIRALARALALALLADADSPDRRTLHALAVRAGHCLGQTPLAPDPQPLPEALFEQLRRLSTMSAAEWARLEPEDLATWLCRGFWWRKAGVRNATAPWQLQEDGDLAAEDDNLGLWDQGIDGDGEDDDPRASATPWHQWTDAQLAQSFRAWAASRRTDSTLHWLLRPGTAGMPPAWMGREPLCPLLSNAQDLAQALGIPLEDLLWLAPEHSRWREPQGGGHALPVSHYRYRLLPKASGGLRLLEAPRPRLSATQRNILDKLLAHIPTHEAAHGFVRGRSVGSHAQVHTRQAVVIRFDLADFFTHISATRVRALWRALGHSRPAAELLTRLTTTRTPAAVRERLWEDSAPTSAQMIAQRRANSARLAQLHLPQGAPTSPALANLCALGLDVRLHALAQRFGARYTRYADDLVFSGPQNLQGQFGALRAWVGAIAQDEGFALRSDKTRLMPAHRRQSVTGLVVNQRPNYSREQYDILKARLHRLAQLPGVDVGERTRLEGEIHWACQWLAPTRKDKLQRLFGAIRFTDVAESER